MTLGNGDGTVGSCQLFPRVCPLLNPRGCPWGLEALTFPHGECGTDLLISGPELRRTGPVRADSLIFLFFLRDIFLSNWDYSTVVDGLSRRSERLIVVAPGMGTWIPI